MAHSFSIKNGLHLNFTPVSAGGSDTLLFKSSAGDLTHSSSLPLNRLAPLTANTAVITDSNGYLISDPNVSATELGYLNNVTGNIQTQLDSKQGAVVLTVDRAVISNGSGLLAVSPVTSTELGYVSGVTSAIQTQLNAKQATITGAATTITSADLTVSRALVSNGSGKVAVSTTTSTELGYVSGVTSALQTQLDNKLTVALGALAAGDMLRYQSGNFTNFAIGTNGQVLTVVGGVPTWSTATANGLTAGGTTSQFLRKNSNTDYDASWHTLVLADVTDVTASAAELGILDGALITTNELNFLSGASSNIQTQLGLKLSTNLAQNALFVGNSSNVASQLAAGTNGQVLTVVAGVPTWQTVVGTGTVTSIDVSGGTTGLSFSGGPVTTTGTITMAGTLGAVNGGTGQSTWTTGQTLYASASNTLSKLSIGTTGQILTVAGGVPTWANLANGSGTTAATNAINLGGTLSAHATISGASNTYDFIVTGARNISFDATAPATGNFDISATDIDLGADSITLAATSGSRQFIVDTTKVRIDVGSDATGDLYYRNVSGNFTRLGIGSSSQVLTVNAGVPTWAAPSAGSSLTSTFVGFGDVTNTLVGEAAFTYNFTDNVMKVDRVGHTGQASAPVGTVANGDLYYNTTVLDFQGRVNDQWINITRIPTRTEAGGTYTLVEADRGYILYFTSACVVTGPALSDGFDVTLVKQGTGDVQFAPGVGLTLEAVDDTLSTQYTAATFYYKGSNVWGGYGAFGSSGGGTTYTFENGISESLGNVTLGGTLTGATLIDGVSGTYGIGFTDLSIFAVNGTGTEITFDGTSFDVSTSGTDIVLNSAGNVTLNSTDDVQLNPTGDISFGYTIPQDDTATMLLAANGSNLLVWRDAATLTGGGGGGGITGSGTSGRVTYWSGASSVTSDADFTFNGTTNILAVPYLSSNGFEASIGYGHQGSGAGNESYNISYLGATTGSVSLSIRPQGKNSSGYVEIEGDDWTSGLKIYQTTSPDGRINLYHDTTFETSTAAEFRIVGGAGNSTINDALVLTLEGGAAYTTAGNGAGGSVVVKSGQRRTAGSGLDGNITLDSLTGKINFKGSNAQLGDSDISTFSFIGLDGNSSVNNGTGLNINAGYAYTTSGNGNGGSIFLNVGQRRTAGAGTDGNVEIDTLTGFLKLVQTPANDDALTQVLVRDGATGNIKYRSASSLGGSVSDNVKTERLELGVSSSTVITTGAKGRKYTGVAGTIVGWRLIADTSSTVTVDIWKTNAAVPTNSNSITASAKPSLTAASLNASTTLTGWTTSVSAGDVFILEVESNDNAVNIYLELDIVKS